MKNILKDFVLFVFLVCVYFCGRLALLFLFNTNADTPSAEWYAMGLRFDIMTAAFIVLPSFVFTVIGLFFKRAFASVKLYYAVFAVFVSVVMAIVNVCYFFEYKSQFNYWVFGIVFDDFWAIMSFIWKAYPIVWISLAEIAACVGLWFLFRLIFQKIDSIERLRDPAFAWRVLAAVLCVFAIVVAMRGGRIAGRPLQVRDIAVEPSEFLNNLIPSSAYCLKNEIKKFISSATSGGLKRFSAKESDIPNFVHELYGADCPSLDAALERKAGGSSLKSRPRRIFLIVGEGLSAWPTSDRFQKYALMPNLRELYKTSLYCPQALASGGGTIASVTSMISGLPFTGLDVRGVLNTDTDCSVAPILKNLGYSSTFFYAGQSTWQHLGAIARANAFDNVVGGESMGDLYGSVEWGMRDKDMFDHILKRDIPENSFNMILTVSNHPPFDVDLRAEGCPADLKTENDVRLYHMWYADREIGRFVREISKKYPDSIIIITGDHAARTVPEGEKMSDGELLCVPIVFSGKPITDAGLAPREVSQAQFLDIIPTLVEMLAPKGFDYKAWGENLLLEKRKLPPMMPYACSIDGEIVSFNSLKCPDSMRELSRKYCALAYWKSVSRKKNSAEK